MALRQNRVRKIKNSGDRFHQKSVKMRVSFLNPLNIDPQESPESLNPTSRK